MTEGPKLVFRVRREGPDGPVLEERELSGLPPEELMRHLTAPWDALAGDEEAGGAPAPEPGAALAQRLERSLGALELVLTEESSEPGRRTYALGFRRAGEARVEEVARAEAGAGRLGGRIEVVEAGPEGRATLAAGGSRIHLDNRGVLAVSKNNVLAILHLDVHVTLRAGP